MAEETPPEVGGKPTCQGIKKDGTHCPATRGLVNGYCMVHRAQSGGTAPKLGEAAAPKAAPSKPRAARGNLEAELRDKYRMLAGGITLADEDLGAWTLQKADSLAHAHAELAKENAAVHRFLTAAIHGGVAVYALAETGLWLFGLYTIAQLKAGKLPQKTANAAVMFGVPLMEVDAKMRMRAEPPPADEEAA